MIIPIAFSALNQVHTELRLSFNEYKESLLASSLLHNPDVIAITQKISASILKLLKPHSQLIIGYLEENTEKLATLQKELYGTERFGHLTPQFHLVTDMIHALSDSTITLQQALLIQGLFIYRIYMHLPHDETTLSYKKKLVDQLFPAELFDPKNRGRFFKENSIKNENLTTTLGIARFSFFSNKIPKISLHQKSMQHFYPDEDSDFYQNMKHRALPFVSGPSGHAGSLLLGAALYGQLNTEELYQYSLAIFAYLCAGGNHSWHEVMVVAKRIGVPYQEGHYPTFSYITFGENHETSLFRNH